MREVGQAEAGFSSKRNVESSGLHFVQAKDSVSGTCVLILLLLSQIALLPRISPICTFKLLNSSCSESCEE